MEKAWCLWYFAYILDMFWIYKIWFYFVQVGLTRRQVAGLFLVLRRSQDLLQESDQNEKQRLHKDKKWFGDDPADIKIQLQMQILLERNLFHLFNIFHPKSASTLWQWVSYQKRDQICQMPEISHQNIDSIQHRNICVQYFLFFKVNASYIYIPVWFAPLLAVLVVLYILPSLLVLFMFQCSLYCYLSLLI